MFHKSLLIVFVGTLIWASPLQVATAQTEKEIEESKAAIVELLTRYRRATETSDAKAFFGSLHKDGIFFGTDEKERRTYHQMKEWLEPYFEQGAAWKREVKQLHVYVGPNNQIGWFEELSHRENVGIMRSTGVVQKTRDGWKIIQYNISLPIPNEAVPEVLAIVNKLKDKKGVDTQNSSEEKKPLTDEQRKKIEESFDYVWEKVRDTYWDPNLGGVDWQAAYDELKPRLKTVETENDAIQIMNELVNRMNVSHFAVIPSAAYQALGKSDEKGASGGTTGIDVRIVDDQVIVVAVASETPAAKEKIKTGWIVEKIGDLDVDTKLAEVKKEFKDNPHARVILASAANSRLRGRVGDKLNVTFRDGTEQLIERAIELVPRRGEKVQFGHLPEFSVWVDSKTIDDDIGYFRFNAFMNPTQVMTEYNEFMEANMNANGLIIDVRGNGGGSGEIAMGMIGWLMQGEKASFGKVVLRDHELKLICRPRPETFAGPVVVLIDELSVSAAEFFASGIKDLTNAQLIGTRTAGAVLGSQIERLPTGDGFQFAAANFISIRTGKTLEGVGVAPHQIVEPNRELLLAGKDSAIEAAIQWIHSQRQ